MNAETAYLFRHALLRDAAYQLQLPGDRARLHALAFEVIERIHGPAPLLPEFPVLRAAYVRQPIDSHAAELCAHALAVSGENFDLRWSERLCRYFWRAALHASATHRSAASADYWQRLAAMPALARVWREFSLGRASEAMHDAGDLAQAAALADQAVSLSSLDEKHGAQAVEISADVLRIRGKINTLRGQNSLAESDLRQGLDMLAPLSGFAAHATKSRLLGNLAVLCSLTDRVPEAEQHYKASLDCAELDHDEQIQGVALGGIANLRFVIGENAEAEKYYRRALEIARRIGDFRSECIWLGNLANLLTRAGQADRSELLCAQALEKARNMGDRRLEGMLLNFMADVHNTFDRNQLRTTCLVESLRLTRESGDRRFEASVLGSYAACLQDAGRIAEAKEGFESAATLAGLVADRALQLKWMARSELCAIANHEPGAHESRVLAHVKELQQLGRKREAAEVLQERDRAKGPPPANTEPAS